MPIMFVSFFFSIFALGNSSTQFNYFKIMDKNVYLAKCTTFEKVLIDLACGEVVSSSSDFLELRVTDLDNDVHNVTIKKLTIKFLSVIIDHYLNGL